LGLINMPVQKNGTASTLETVPYILFLQFYNNRNAKINF